VILLVDNYDSFVHNLARYIRELDYPCTVQRNDALDLDALDLEPPSHIVISPGPGSPDGAGACNALIARFGARVPILGVCLGHQCIGQVYGGRIVRGAPVHGKTSMVRHGGHGLFAGLPDPLRVGRYHSLVVDPDSLPAELQVIATEPTGAIMALAHRSHPVMGVQFHPESVLTEGGHRLLENFLGAPDGQCLS
jgi:para-aminobenzoate synthetase component II